MKTGIHIPNNFAKEPGRAELGRAGRVKKRVGECSIAPKPVNIPLIHLLGSRRSQGKLRVRGPTGLMGPKRGTLFLKDGKVGTKNHDLKARGGASRGAPMTLRERVRRTEARRPS